MKALFVSLVVASVGALALGACSDDDDEGGTAGYGGGSAGAGTGGGAGTSGSSGSSGSAGTAGAATDGGGEDASAGSAGSSDDGGAGSAGSPTDGGEEGAAPGASWTQVYTTVISQKCTPCHTTPNGGGISNGKLDMSTQEIAYANLVNAPAAGNACAGQGTRVVPGSAEDSLLYKKVSPGEAAPCGAKMPLGGPELSKDEADAIESWINAGALDD